MPMPFTRPINSTQTLHTPAALQRTPAPPLALPPSNGVALPYGQGVVHTVKNSNQIVGGVTRAAVT